MVNACPHCGVELFSRSSDGERLLIARTALVIHKSGLVEVNCAQCRNGVLLPLVIGKDKTLRKGRTARSIVFGSKSGA